MQRSPRVVSLLPSATEIVCALDATDLLVGISHECDYPDSIRDRKVLTSSRIDPSGTSREIDIAVREALVREALSVYKVDDAGLATLDPDVVVTQDLCEVCAVSLDDVRTAVARLAIGRVSRSSACDRRGWLTCLGTSNAWPRHSIALRSEPRFARLSRAGSMRLRSGPLRPPTDHASPLWSGSTRSCSAAPGCPR